MNDESRGAITRRAFGQVLGAAALSTTLPGFSTLATSSGRRWLRARRPELYDSPTRPTGQEQETRRVRFGE